MVVPLKNEYICIVKNYISSIIMIKEIWENSPLKTLFYINIANEGIVL